MTRSGSFAGATDPGGTEVDEVEVDPVQAADITTHVATTTTIALRPSRLACACRLKVPPMFLHDEPTRGLRILIDACISEVAE